MIEQLVELYGFVSVRVGGWYNAETRAIAYSERFGLPILNKIPSHDDCMFNVQVTRDGITITMD